MTPTQPHPTVELLDDIIATLNARREIDEALQRVIDKMRDTLRPEVVRLSLLDPRE